MEPTSTGVIPELDGPGLESGRADYAGAVVALIWPAAVALSLAIAVGGRHVTALGLILVMSGTTAAYGLDRLIDRREVEAPQARLLLTTAVLFASLVGGVMALTALWRLKVCVLLGVMAGGYVPLKRWVPKNVLTVPAWTIAISVLPFAEVPEFSGSHAAATVALALIITANTLLCDVGDIAADRAAGVVALAARFGAPAAATVAGCAGLLGAVAAVAGSKWSLALTALGMTALAFVLGRSPTKRWARLAVDGILTVLPGPLWFLIG